MNILIIKLLSLQDFPGQPDQNCNSPVRCLRVLHKDRTKLWNAKVLMNIRKEGISLHNELNPEDTAGQQSEIRFRKLRKQCMHNVNTLSFHATDCNSFGEVEGIKPTSWIFDTSVISTNCVPSFCTNNSVFSSIRCFITPDSWVRNLPCIYICKKIHILVWAGKKEFSRADKYWSGIKIRLNSLVFIFLNYF